MIKDPIAMDSVFLYATFQSALLSSEAEVECRCLGKITEGIRAQLDKAVLK